MGYNLRKTQVIGMHTTGANLPMICQKNRKWLGRCAFKALPINFRHNRLQIFIEGRVKRCNISILKAKFLKYRKNEIFLLPTLNRAFTIFYRL